MSKTGGTCTYVIGATTGGGDTFTVRNLTGGGKNLPFNLYTTSARTSIVKDLPNATASEVVSGTFSQSGNRTNTHTWFFDIAPQQVVAPTTYQATMQMKLYSGSVSNGTFVQSVNVTHSAVVASTAELSLVATGGAFNSSSTTQTLNLGTMSTLQSLGLDMRVRGNTAFDVQLQSQNLGVLKQSDISVTDTVPYSLTVNGLTIGLSGASGTTITGSSVATGQSGALLPVVVTVNAASGTAGTYSDVISVSVISH